MNRARGIGNILLESAAPTTVDERLSEPGLVTHQLDISGKQEVIWRYCALLFCGWIVLSWGSTVEAQNAPR